jgi:hypothetical protein
VLYFGIFFIIYKLFKFNNMNTVLKVFLRGLVIAIIISLPQFPADGKITTLMMWGVVATIISYIMTHVIMLAPYIKNELASHFQWNITSTVSTALFTILNAAGVYLVNHLANPSTITLTAFVGVIWAAAVYAVRTYALNSENQFKVEPPNKIYPADSNIEKIHLPEDDLIP